MMKILMFRAKNKQIRVLTQIKKIEERISATNHIGRTSRLSACEHRTGRQPKEFSRIRLRNAYGTTSRHRERREEL